MRTHLQSKRFPSPNEKRRQSQGGFSLLEMVVAMMIMTVGLLGVASAISYALMASNRGRGITNAKMLMVSILEQMETMRDTGQLHFNEISNSQVAGSTFTGFPTTFQPVSTKPGPDGVFGTADDLINPGPDGIWGTPDDFTDLSLARPGVQRKIIITTLLDNDYLKKIQVTLRYSPNGGTPSELTCTGYLNDNEHGNYIP
jgi:prepilin-type N-terminal cleavage/methylation domain-containing protein